MAIRTCMTFTLIVLLVVGVAEAQSNLVQTEDSNPIWTPQPGSRLDLDRSPRIDLRPVDPELRTHPAGLFQQDPGNGSSGGCSTSCSVACLDETFCSATCSSLQCAWCGCDPSAICGCDDAP